MSLPRLRRSTTLAYQALVTGRVLDSLTNAPPLGGLEVRLLDQDTDRDYPLAKRVHADGSFAFYGTPDLAFPRLETQTYRLRLEAHAPRYQMTNLEFEVGPLPGQPEEVSRTIPLAGVEDMRVRLFTAAALPQTDLALSLNREPVTLIGRILVSDNPTAGVGGAMLTVTAPPGPSTTTNTEGQYAFPSALPVTLAVQIEVQATGFESEVITYEPDYTRPENVLLIGLKSSDGE